MGWKPFCIALLMAVLAPARPYAIEGDENWSPIFALPGADGDVYCSLPIEGDLIVGGEFRHIGLCAADRIARFDGTDWSPMGDGFDGVVHALTVHQGDLYAAGDFDHSGTVAAAGIARWNGEAWEPLSEQVDYYSIRALCSHNGSLVAGGIADTFIIDGEYFEQGFLAVFDGAQWTEIADFDCGWFCRINDLISFAGDLIAGGEFDGIGGNEDIQTVARWDGYSWYGMGELCLWTCDCYALLIHEGELFAGTNFGLHRWSGEDWEDLWGGPGGIQDLVNYSDGIAACGDIAVDDGYGAAFWDGNTWSAIGAPFGNPDTTEPRLYTLSVFDGMLVVGGYFSQAGRTAIPQLAAWDGLAWKALPEPSDSSQFKGLDDGAYAVGVYDDRIVAGGRFDYSYGATLDGIGIWNGASWQGLGTGFIDQEDCVYAFAAWQGDLIVGGSFDEIGGISSPNVAAWNGADWQAIGWPEPYYCYALLANGPHLYAAGYRYPESYIERWDGNGWSDLNGGLDGTVSAMVLYDGELVAGGDFTADVHGQALGCIAGWDGAAWHPLGGGFDAAVRALVVWDGKLVAGGRFTAADGQPASALAWWDGVRWRSFPGQLDDGVRALAVLREDLIVGGSFATIDGVAVNGIARWDDLSWSALGSGMAILEYQSSPYVLSLATLGDQLFAAGPFRNAGGKMSDGIACWLDTETALPGIPIPPRGLAAGNWPNPFNPGTEIGFTLPCDAPVTLRVFDLQGREVRRLLDRVFRPAGEVRMLWDGRNDAGHPLPSGVYFLEVEAAGFETARKMTLLK